MGEKQKKKFQSILLKWSSDNLRKFPWRKKKISPFKIFLAEMLLKRTTAKAASTVYPKLSKKYSTLKQLATAKEKDIFKLVKPIGYPQRSREMITAAKFLVNNYHSSIPDEKKSLMEIPYVGDYISGAILSLGYDKAYTMVDSNVNRIISRVYFGCNAPTHIKKEIRNIAKELLPRTRHKEFNFALLDVGGLFCHPRFPKCELCPLQKICKFSQKNPPKG